MNQKKPFIYSFSIVVLLLMIILSAGFLYTLNQKIKEKEREAKRLSQELSLMEEDNELLQKQLDQITENIKSYQNDDHYGELELWKELRKQLKEPSSY